MNLAALLKPNEGYGRKLFRSALEGAHSGEEAYLHGKPFTGFVDESARNALKPAILAACLGLLGGYTGYRHRSPGRAMAYGVLGGTIGFSVGLAWQSWGLTASIASAAWKKIGRTRDEHWLDQNPIDYA